MKPDLLKAFVSGILLFLIGARSFPAHADDYVRDPAPTVNVRGEPIEDYAKASDPEVCDLYLKNLQYFARRNEPLSCGQPVAPMLKSRIQPIEWEPLDIDKYPELFKAALKSYDWLGPPVGNTVPDEKYYAYWRKLVNDKSAVFLRAKLTLKKLPTYYFFRGNDPRPLPINEPFQIVAFGRNLLDPNAPPPFQCKQHRGRRTPYSSTSGMMSILIVSEDLRRIYRQLGDQDQDATDAWVINGQLYGEVFDNDGDVRLMQFPTFPDVALEPICLYHFDQAMDTAVHQSRLTEEPEGG